MKTEESLRFLTAGNIFYLMSVITDESLLLDT